MVTVFKFVNRVDNDGGDAVNTVWCFLENIRDPFNPASGCYPDTTWSPKDGRFWSSEACNGLPPLDTDQASSPKVLLIYFKQI